MSREVARYDYTLGSTRESAIVYDDDLKIHNHSDTNPARGQHNAFDLVRLHKYGALDKDIDPATPMTERPSFKAMVAFAEELPEIQAQRVAAEFQDPGELPAADWLDPPKQSRFRCYKAGEFLKMPRPREIVRGVLPEADLAIVVGVPGSGKTFLCLSLGAAIQRGDQWFGRETRKGRTVFGVFEGVRGFRNRVDAYMRAFDVKADDMPDIIYDVPNLLEVADAKEFAASVGQASVIFLDTMARVHGGDENAGSDMGRLLKSLKYISSQTGALVVLLHHPPHDGNRARGWSGLTGAADAVIAIEKSDVVRSASIVKAKDAVEGPLLNFKIVPFEVGTDDWGQPETGGIIELVDGPGVVRAARIPKPGTKARTALDAVKALIVTANGPVDLDDARAAVADTKSEPEPGQKDRRGARATEEIDGLVRQALLFRVNGKLSDTQLVTGADEAF